MKNLFTKLSVVQKISFAISVMFLIVSVCVAVYGSGQIRQSKLSYEQNEATLRELNAELESIKLSDDTTDTVRVKLNSASSAGTKVAELQNKYKSINVLTSEEELKENAAAIGKYMVDKSCQVRWYAATNMVTPKWEFCSTYSFTGDSIPVLWVCYSDNEAHELLGYTTGVYSAQKDMFDKVEYHVSTIGDSYINSNYTTSSETDAEPDNTSENKSDGNTVDNTPSGEED